MGDPRYNDDERIEAIKFNLDKADEAFHAALSSATTEEQVREAIDDLVESYSNAISDSSKEEKDVYIPRYIQALNSLMSLSEDLKSTITADDAESALNIFEDFPAEPGDLEKHQNEKEWENSLPSTQWGNQIEAVFQELGVVAPSLSEAEIAELKEKQEAERIAKQKELMAPIEPFRRGVESLPVVEQLREKGMIVDIMPYALSDGESRLEVIVKIPKEDGAGYSWPLKIYWKRTGPEANSLKCYKQGEPPELKECTEEHAVEEIGTILEEYDSGQ